MAYVSLVIVADWNVPPMDEQKAEHAAAPKHDAIQPVAAIGTETRAPMAE